MSSPIDRASRRLTGKTLEERLRLEIEAIQKEIAEAQNAVFVSSSIGDAAGIKNEGHIIQDLELRLESCERDLEKHLKSRRDPNYTGF